MDDGVVVLEGATIAYAGPAEDAPTTPDAELVEVDTVLPGLWDCHTHLVGLRTISLAGLLEVPVAVKAARATADLRRALAAGVTSIRDAGGMGVLLGRAVREGSIVGPHCYGAGAVLSTTGGHGDLHDLPLEWMHDLTRLDGTLRVCDGVDGVMTAVREQLRIGADVIKVCASGGVVSERDHPIHQQFTDAELAAIVEVAGLAERTVMAHCHGKPGMMAAIEAGVGTIEHGTYLDEEVCAAMVERELTLVPTRLIVTDLIAAGQGPLTDAMWTKLVATDARHRDAVAMAHEAGVRIAMGTDLAMSVPGAPASWGRHGRELVLLTESGLSPLEAIEAATANGPGTLGPRAPHTGQLVAGFDADVVTVTGDPSVDIEVLADPANVTGVWVGGEQMLDAV
ncbi:MAG: amidohydrolase family protein [Nitriliruptor sp.]|nr:MAG: amidohydrolase family protein [Nitriliruptor sp.]